MASTSNTPQPFNPEDFANAAAAVASQLAAGGDAAQRPLRTSQSFRMDEGYSGEETPSLYEDPNQRDDMRSARDSAELRIPAWMTGLNDALREGLFVFCRTQFSLFLYLVRHLRGQFTIQSFGPTRRCLEFESGLCRVMASRGAHITEGRRLVPSCGTHVFLVSRYPSL